MVTGIVPLVLGNKREVLMEDFGKLAPYSSEDYSYTADTNPPVLRTTLRHFIEHPSHAPKHPHHRPRVPKKVRGPLLLDKSLTPREGYGLYIQERICWSKVFAIEAVLATACIIFAIVWCTKYRGGIQDGFAIAGTGDCECDDSSGCFAGSRSELLEMNVQLTARRNLG
jgi:hypothetical protein